MEEIHTEEMKKETSKVASFLGDKSNFLGMSILVSAVIMSGTLVYVFGPNTGGNAGTAALTPTAVPTGQEDVAVPSGAPEVGDAPTLGDSNAPVTIYPLLDEMSSLVSSCKF